MRDSPTSKPIGTFPDGSLISIGTCAAGRHDLAGGFECLGARASWGTIDGFVRGEEVYVLTWEAWDLGADAFALLSKYTGGEWLELHRFNPGEVPSVLLDLGKEVVIAGEDGLVLRGDPDRGNLRRLTGPDISYYSGAAMQGGTFALIGTRFEVVINQGGDWSILPDLRPISVARSATLHPHIYLSLDTQDGLPFARLDPHGEHQAVLDLADAGYVKHATVNSDQDIIMLIDRPELFGHQCGPIMLAWFDGTEIHIF